MAEARLERTRKVYGHEGMKGLKEYTDITLLIDRSGSMHHIRESMERGLRDFIKDHKKVPSSRLTIIKFDDIDDHDVVFNDLPIRHAEKISINPRGNTPLIDAFCKAIDKTGDRLRRKPQEERPDQVLFVVITDGLENASHRYRRRDLFDRITKQREDYKWQFVYLGANQDAIAESRNWGIDRGSTLSYGFSGQHVNHAMKSMNINTLSYAQNSGGLRGQSVVGFSDEQREEAIDAEELEKNKKLTTE